MEILMTFLNEQLRKENQQKQKRERNEQKKTYTSIFGLFFYNQMIPSKRQQDK